MAIKWYQRAAVQGAFVIGIFGLAGAIITAYYSTHPSTEETLNDRNPTDFIETPRSKDKEQDEAKIHFLEIYGHVQDSLSGVVVTLIPFGLSGTSDLSGDFRILVPDTLRGSLEVHAHKSGLKFGTHAFLSLKALRASIPIKIIKRE